mgnify:CR=1 FL=1
MIQKRHMIRVRQIPANRGFSGKSFRNLFSNPLIIFPIRRIIWGNDRDPQRSSPEYCLLKGPAHEAATIVSIPCYYPFVSLIPFGVITVHALRDQQWNLPWFHIEIQQIAPFSPYFNRVPIPQQTRQTSSDFSASRQQMRPVSSLYSRSKGSIGTIP